MQRLYFPFVLLALSIAATCAPAEEEAPAPEQAPTALACYRTAAELFCIEKMTTYSE